MSLCFMTLTRQLYRVCAQQHRDWTLLLGRGPPRGQESWYTNEIPMETGCLEDTAYRCDFGQKDYASVSPNSEITRIKRARWVGMFESKANVKTHLGSAGLMLAAQPKAGVSTAPSGRRSCLGQCPHPFCGEDGLRELG